MKKIANIAFICILSSISTNVFAGEEHKTYEKKPVVKMEDRSVLDYDFDLSISIDGSVAKAEWNEFTKEGFQWFKLVYSTTNPKPVYPHDKTVFVGNKEQLSNSFKLQPGTAKHYVRICAVTLNSDYSKDRYCSEVQTIETTVSGEQAKHYDKTQYKNKESAKPDSDKKELAKKQALKKAYDKKVAAKKDTTTKKTDYLSKNITQRINTIVKNFINRLEAEDYSDEKIVETIDIILERLTKYADNKKYDLIVPYMEKSLLKYRADYDSGLSELESIFSDF